MVRGREAAREHPGRSQGDFGMAHVRDGYQVLIFVVRSMRVMNAAEMRVDLLRSWWRQAGH